MELERAESRLEAAERYLAAQRASFFAAPHCYHRCCCRSGWDGGARVVVHVAFVMIAVCLFTRLSFEHARFYVYTCAIMRAAPLTFWSCRP